VGEPLLQMVLRCPFPALWSAVHMCVHSSPDIDTNATIICGCCVQGVTLTPELWLVKLMVGAVDPTYVSPGPFAWSHAHPPT
jgi:hypothetical protein